MSAKSRATQYRQWAANAIVAAMRTTSQVEQETLLMIARQHLARAQKADHPAPDNGSRRAKHRTKH